MLSKRSISLTKQYTALYARISLMEAFYTRTVVIGLNTVLGRFTTDNGTEFACHEMIAKSIGTKVYFADPYSSWQKGAIKNVNGLIRQYIPKNTCFSNISQQQITKIMQKINTRPREKLNFSTPNECFYKKML